MFFKQYFLALFIFIILDALWLGLIAKDFYKQNIGYLMTENIRWIAAVIFYLIYIAGVIFFAVNPALKDNSLLTAAVYGAILGLICYATYDLTNLATIKNWPLKVTIIDLIWGTILTSFVAFLTTYIASRGKFFFK
jgi:uncharacterized membrane protein